MWRLVLLVCLMGVSLSSCESMRSPVDRKRAHFDVRDYGATPDGKTKSTEAIRKAIDAAVAAGGGTILFPPGQYLTGPIRLKSNITLLVDAGAVLKFSADFDDYLPMVRTRWEGTEVTGFSPLISADKAENIAIHGRGVLDGQGEAWWSYFRALKQDRKKTGVWKTDSKWQQEFIRQNADLELPDDPEMLKMGFLRPPFIQVLDCKNVSIEDVKIVNSPFWTINPVYSDNVTVRGVTIDNPNDSPNTDGIDPESCRNVHISDCHINAGDDCVTIKSGRDRQGRRINRPAENYTITNCTMLHGHGGVVIGSEMSGGVKKIAVSNCVFEGTDRGIRIKTTRGRGGVVEDVSVSNIVMKDIRGEAITLNMFYTDVPPEPVTDRTPRFKNIHLSGITGDAEQAGVLLGLGESPLEDVSLSDIHLTAKKGITIKDAKNIRLDGVRVDTAAGPALFAELTENLSIFGVGTNLPHADTPVIELTNVKQAYVHGCFAAPNTDLFLRVKGSISQGIVVDGNDLLGAKNAVVSSPDLRERPVLVGARAGGPIPILEAK
jgi:Glycosyl hydrolases family 28/Pectate lyase superfamily protein